MKLTGFMPVTNSGFKFMLTGSQRSCLERCFRDCLILLHYMLASIGFPCWKENRKWERQIMLY